MDFSEITYEALLLITKIGGPVLLLTLVIGLVVSIFQTLTQIQEQTLSFLPKLISVILCLWIMHSYASHMFSKFTQHIFDMIASRNE